MPTFTANDCQKVVANALHGLRAQFLGALDNVGENGNVLVALKKELYVDQLRRIVTSTRGGEQRWSRRDGKYFLATANEQQRSGLTLFVGANRFLSAEVVFLIVADILGGKRVRASEANVASFMNLLVVEPYYHPERELPIWLTIAVNLAQSRYGDDLHAELPALGTDFDPLSAELPPTGPYVEQLKPRPKHETAAAQKMRLLGVARPDLAPTIASLATDDERARLFAAHEADLRAYVHEQLFGRVAAAVNAAEGAYAWARPPDE
jgi:hypothetical protein